MKQETVKMYVGVTRQSQIDQGFFDGRFVTRTQASKKQYTRKQKHKNKSND